MQSLSLHQNSGYQPAAMINRNQPVSVDKHDQIRDAVRAWAGADGQDVVTALIIEEYQAQGGYDITFPDDLCRKRQKLSALFAALLSGRIFAPFGKIQICIKSCP